MDRLGVDGDLHAPHLLDVELLRTLRRLVIVGRLSEERAAPGNGAGVELFDGEGR